MSTTDSTDTAALTKHRQTTDEEPEAKLRVTVLAASAAIGFRHGSAARRAARWTAVVAVVGVPFAMLAPGWWLAALVGSMVVAHAIEAMVGFAARHPGATHRDLATCLVVASCVAPALLAWRLGGWALRAVGREVAAPR